MLIKYCIPGYYLFHSRLKRKSEIISLLYVYPLFLFLFIYFWGDFDFLKFAITFVGFFFSWLSFYEIGYLENDVFTIKKELNPTLRISQSEIAFLENNYKKVIIIRYLIGIAILSVFFFLEKNNWLDLNILGFFGFVILAALAFKLHNAIRSKWNIVTYFFLSFSKYLAIPVLFSNQLPDFIYLVVLILLLFPIPRTLEHASKIKYRLPIGRLIGNLDRFRVLYYFFIVLISVVILFFENSDSSKIYVFASLWFFVFRLASYVMIKFGSYKRSNFTSHNWK